MPLDRQVDLIFRMQEGILVFHARHGVAVGNRFDLQVLLIHEGIIAQHDHQRKNEHSGGHEDGAGVGLFQFAHLTGDEHLVRKTNRAAVHGGQIILANILHHVMIGFHHGLTHPNQRDEQHQPQKHHPDDQGFAKALGMIPLKNAAEVEEAQNRPDNKQEIGLPGHRALRYQVGKQQIQQIEDHQHQADPPRPQLCAIVSCLRQLPGACRNQRVNDGCADCCDVHDPADCRAPEERNGQRQAGDQQNGLARSAMPIQRRKPGRQNLILSQGVKQAAEGGGIADQTGDDQRQQGDHQDAHAEMAHVVLGGVKGGQGFEAVQIANVPDIFQPGAVFRRIGRHGQQRNEDIQRRGGYHRHQQDAEKPTVLKTDFLRQMRDILKANKSPWGNDGNFDDLRNGAALRDIGRTQRDVQMEESTDKHHGDAQHKDDGQDHHQPRGGALARHQENRGEGDGRQRKQGFAKVNLIAEKRIQAPEAENVPQKIPRKEGQRRGVCPENRQIGHGKEPRGQKAMVIAELLLGKGVRAARFRIALHHISIVPADDQHGRRAQQETEHAAHDAGL